MKVAAGRQAPPLLLPPPAAAVRGVFRAWPRHLPPPPPPPYTHTHTCTHAPAAATAAGPQTPAGPQHAGTTPPAPGAGAALWAHACTCARGHVHTPAFAHTFDRTWARTLAPRSWHGWSTGHAKGARAPGTARAHGRRGVGHGWGHAPHPHSLQLLAQAHAHGAGPTSRQQDDAAESKMQFKSRVGCNSKAEWDGSRSRKQDTLLFKN